MPKLSSYTAALNLSGASIPILQGGQNRVAQVSVMDSRWGVYQSASDPTNGDDADDGFVIGQRWLNTSTMNEFLCVQANAGAAIWRHIPRVLGSSAVASSGPADLAENILATVSVPGGAMGVNGALRVKCMWTHTGSTNSKNWKVRLGGIGGTPFFSNGDTTASITELMSETLIQNVNSQSTQKGLTRALTNVGSIFVTTKQSGAINTASTQTLVITGAKGSAGETLTLDSYTVELLRPDIT